MSDSNTATIRTTVNTVVIFVIGYIASKVSGHEIDTSDPWIIPIAAAVVGVIYRLSKVISEKVPWTGYVLFGINRSPAYTTPPPAVPALADDPPPAA